MMTGIVVVLATLIGAVTGCVLTMTIATAAIAHSQDRMARKVRYWQAETARAREALQRARSGIGADTSASGDFGDR
jgi:outer membrane lipoprotein SlyB